MNTPPNPHAVTTAAQLAALFGEVGAASIQKEVSFVHPHYRALIEASPFAVLATAGPDGLDASPRGDAPGLVVVQGQLPKCVIVVKVKTVFSNARAPSSVQGCGRRRRPTRGHACRLRAPSFQR